MVFFYFRLVGSISIFKQSIESTITLQAKSVHLASATRGKGELRVHRAMGHYH